METLIEVLLTGYLLGFPAAYMLNALLLEKKDSHEGPFKSASLQVVWPAGYLGEAQHAQQVALFDWVRRLCGAYSVKGNMWVVKIGPLGELWTCSFCLSFWVSFFFSAPYAIYIANISPSFPILLWWPFVHTGIAITSQLVYKSLFDDE